MAINANQYFKEHPGKNTVSINELKSWAENKNSNSNSSSKTSHRHNSGGSGRSSGSSSSKYYYIPTKSPEQTYSGATGIIRGRETLQKGFKQTSKKEYEKYQEMAKIARKRAEKNRLETKIKHGDRSAMKEWNKRYASEQKVTSVITVKNPKTNKIEEIPIARTKTGTYLYTTPSGEIREVKIPYGKSYPEERIKGKIAREYQTKILGKTPGATSYGSVKAENYGKYKLAQDYVAIKTGKKSGWINPQGKLVTAPLHSAPAGMNETIAKQRGFTKISPEKIIEAKEKSAKKPETRTPEQTLKEIRKSNLSVVPTASLALLGNKNIKDIYSGKIPTGEIGINDYTVMKTKDVPKMAKTLSPSEVTVYKGSLMTSKQAKRLYEATPEYATKIGKMAFVEMRKKGTLNIFEGLVASGTRPWSMEVAGTQIAESLHQVKKGTTQKLLIQRLGEDIIQTKKEGITFGGYIRRLAEAPSSVIGASIVTAGVGSAFVGVRGALAGNSVKMKNAFDITMAGLGLNWLGSRTKEIAVAEKSHDISKSISLGLQTIAEVGGAIIGAGMVKAVSPKGEPIELKPKNMIKSDVKTLKTKTIGELNTGKIEIGMETPEGKTVSVKVEFTSITKDGVTKGYIKIPKQKVGEIEIKPQKILLRQKDIANILSYGKKTIITKPTTEPLYLEGGKKVGEIVEPKKTIYQPYTERGLPYEQKLTFTKKKGLPEQTQKYLDIMERLKNYKIVPEEAMDIYGEKGQIERVAGSKLTKRTAIGKTGRGMRYGIEEVSMEYEPTTLEKIHLQVTRNIDKVYEKAISKKTTPESTKKVIERPEKPISSVDRTYRDVSSNVDRNSRQLLKPRVQEKPVEPSKVGKVVRQVEKLKIKGLEKTVKPKITKLLPRGTAPPISKIFENITKTMNQNMRVMDIGQKGKIRIKPPEEIKIVQGFSKDIIPIQTVDEDYQIIQDNIINNFEQIEPVIEPSPKPPKPKPPEKISKGYPPIPIFGAPMGIGLGAVDSQYRTMTRYIKHKMPTIEELLKM